MKPNALIMSILVAASLATPALSEPGNSSGKANGFGKGNGNSAVFSDGTTQQDTTGTGTTTGGGTSSASGDSSTTSTDGGYNITILLEEDPNRVISIDSNFDGFIDEVEYIDYMVGREEYDIVDGVDQTSNNAITLADIYDSNNNGAIAEGDDKLNNGEIQREIRRKHGLYKDRYQSAVALCLADESCRAKFEERGNALTSLDPIHGGAEVEGSGCSSPVNGQANGIGSCK